MRSLVCVQPGLFEYKEINEPVWQKDHALLRIKRIGICGTDLHAYEGTQPYFEYPRILGHELAATVAAVDESSGFSIDEVVTFIPYFNCGNCNACNNNKPNCCVQLKVCGVHVDGGMVEYLSVPVHTLLHGDDLSLDTLALAEPLAIGAHSIRRAAVKAGDYVLVTGAGPIGLAAMEFARIAGAHIIALETNQNRLNVCKNIFGFDYIINARDENVKEQVMEITNGSMPAVIVDATGNLQAINNAFGLMAHGGKFVLVGLQKGNISFSHPEFHKREGTLMSSRNATRQDFDHVINCLQKKLIKPGNFITHHTIFDNVKAAFPGWLNADSGVIKAMVEMG